MRWVHQERPCTVGISGETSTCIGRTQFIDLIYIPILYKPVNFEQPGHVAAQKGAGNGYLLNPTLTVVNVASRIVPEVFWCTQVG
jgi:hypothetical protein